MVRNRFIVLKINITNIQSRRFVFENVAFLRNGPYGLGRSAVGSVDLSALWMIRHWYLAPY